jgi:hypothetical protein
MKHYLTVPGPYTWADVRVGDVIHYWYVGMGRARYLRITRLESATHPANNPVMEWLWGRIVRKDGTLSTSVRARRDAAEYGDTIAWVGVGDLITVHRPTFDLDDLHAEALHLNRLTDRALDDLAASRIALHAAEEAAQAARDELDGRERDLADAVVFDHQAALTEDLERHVTAGGDLDSWYAERVEREGRAILAASDVDTVTAQRWEKMLHGDEPTVWTGDPLVLDIDEAHTADRWTQFHNGTL